MVITVEDPGSTPSSLAPPPWACPPPAATRVHRYFDPCTTTDTEDEEEVEECYGVRSRKRRKTSNTETQRSLWDSDEESVEERRRREADLWSDHTDSDAGFQCDRPQQPPSPSPPPPPPPPPEEEEEEEEEEEDMNKLVDVIVQTAVDASMTFARRLFASAPLVTAPVAPYVATYPQCQCFDGPPPPLPFQQQATPPPPPPPPPSAPSQQQQPPPPPAYYNGLRSLPSFSPYQERA